MLEELKKLGQPHIEVVTAKKKTKDVDKELLSTAKKMHGKVATVDFNLNRVSKVSGVEVLNVNYLANALKTIVLPGERIKVKVIQEGTANKQGVGFLEDGTMVVVEEGRTLVGKQIDVVVTRVLQTEAGRMIFAKNPSKL